MLDTKIIPRFAYCSKCEKVYKITFHEKVQCPICCIKFTMYCTELPKEKLLNDKDCSQCEDRFSCWTER